MVEEIALTADLACGASVDIVDCQTPSTAVSIRLLTDSGLR